MGQGCRRPRSWQALCCALLATHIALLLISSRLQSPTRNEVAHVPAGIYYWATRNFQVYSVNPPLAKMLACLPTYLLLQPKLEGLALHAEHEGRPECVMVHTSVDFWLNNSSPESFKAPASVLVKLMRHR